MKRLFYGISKRRVVATILMVMLFSLFNSMFTTFMSNTLNLKSQPELKDAIIGIFCFLLVWLTEEFLLDMLTSTSRVLLENALYKSYFNKIYEIKPEILKQNNTGYISGLLRKCTTDQQNAFDMFVDVGLNLVYIGYFAITFMQFQVWIGVAVIVLGLLSSLIRVLIRKTFIADVLKKTVHAASNKDKVFIDCTSNINTSQRLQSRQFFCDLMDKVNLEHYKTHVVWKFRDEWAFIIGKGLTFMFAPIALSLVYLFQPDLLNNAFCMALIVTVSVQLPHNARAIARFVSAYDKFATAIATFDNIVNDNNKRMPICEDSFGRLDIRDMNFTYHENSNEAMLIRIPEFTVERGDFIVITGESGQGKTTLLNIMTGEIETDSVVINNTTRNHRPDCVFIAQDTEMFDLSIRDNLTLGKFVPDDTLIWLLDEVGMGDWIRNTPDGLDTMLGERGIFVSTGQRQRLNLIRGLLCRDKEIYILDEPTSNVDAETEMRIVALIKELLRYKTVVCVTHRQPIVQLSNKQYVFENGMLQSTFKCIDT